MKKILFAITIFIFSLFIYLPSTYAINYYESVTIKTVFEEDINTDEIEWINVVLSDSTEYSKEYLLEKDKNFELNVENVPVGPYKFSYGVVNDDEIGYYRVSGEISIDENLKNVEVTIIVSLQNNKKYNDIEINEETKNELVGNSTSNSKTTTKKANTSDVELEDDDEDDEDADIIIGEEEEKEEKSEEQKTSEKDEEEIEKEKEEKRKRNNLIGKILFSIIGITLLVIGIFVAIKISRANK